MIDTVESIRLKCLETFHPADDASDRLMRELSATLDEAQRALA